MPMPVCMWLYCVVCSTVAWHTYFYFKRDIWFALKLMAKVRNWNHNYCVHVSRDILMGVFLCIQLNHNSQRIVPNKIVTHKIRDAFENDWTTCSLQIIESNYCAFFTIQHKRTWKISQVQMEKQHWSMYYVKCLNVGTKLEIISVSCHQVSLLNRSIWILQFQKHSIF